jgi:diguanylate cyclase (GGDEF)-like protein
MVGTVSDVTVEQEARELLAASEQRYRDLALHDPLTGLANRKLFNDRLGQLLARRAPGPTTTIIMVDLDGFKGVNDALGHAAGDELLVEVARRLLGCTRPEDTVARLGGDEFCAVVTCDPADGPGRYGERVVAALGDPYELGGLVVHSAASVGVATQTPPRDSAEALMLRADVALYEAKGAGGGRCVVYDEVLEASAHLRRGPAGGRPRALSAP